MAFLSFIITLVIAFPARSSTVLGPKQYARTGGAPNIYIDTFQSMGGAGSLIIRNGNAAGTDRVKGPGGDYAITSAKVYLNGAAIFRPSDFKRTIHYLEKSVQLNNGTNTLHVELSSAPGSYITAEVHGTPPTVFSLAQIDTLLRTKWAGLENALTNRDIPMALTLLRPISRDRYQTMFHLLTDQLPAIAADNTALVLDSIEGDFGFYELKTLENGSVFSYRVIFSRDPASGLWLIEEF